MADISKIKLPSGSTYDIKDSVARETKIDKPSMEGTSGQVLSTDGNGGTAWADQPDVITGIHVGETTPTDPNVQIWLQPDGESDVVGIEAEATQLPAGSSPTAEFDASGDVLTLQLGLPAPEKGDRGDTVIIANKYEDLTFPVAEGTYCLYNNLPYVSKQAIATSEAWTAAHWDQVSFEDEIGELKNAIQHKADAIGELKNAIQHKADAIYNTVENQEIVHIEDGADNMPFKSLVVGFQPYQVGTGDPSPSNIRPIKGATQVSVFHNSINIWDEEWENGYWNVGTGEPVDNSLFVRCKNFIKVTPSTSYRFVVGYNNTHQLITFDENRNVISHPTVSQNVTFTTPANCHYIKFYLNWQYGNTYNHDVSINYPSTDTEYHAFSGVAVDWTSEAGTVYGGTLDVTTGELKQTWKAIDLSAAAIQYSGNLAKLTIDDIKYPPFWNSVPSFIAEKYYAAPRTINLNDYPDAICQFDNQILKYYDGNTHMSGLFVYELATPITHHLTPKEIKTLLGTNNIWADTGSIIHLEYPCDTKTYVDDSVAPISPMIAPVEAGYTASQAYSVGSYLIVNKTLYKVISAIANGGTITPGTNVTATTIMAELAALA